MSVQETFSQSQAGDLGLFGNPVKHSLSAYMQNAAFQLWYGTYRDTNRQCPTYHLFHIEADQLGEAFHWFETIGLKGVNITVPHKIAAVKYVSKLEGAAKRLQTINTVVRQNNNNVGYNTDADGFIRSLEHDLHFSPAGKKCLVLGAGGTGRVLVSALLDEAATHVTLWNRQCDRFDEIRKQQSDRDSRIAFVSDPDLRQLTEDIDLIVNATSVGLHENNESGLPLVSLGSSKTVLDVIYHRETKFMRDALDAHAQVSNGLGMLVYQGAKAFELWTGTPAPVEVMKQALLSHLQK